MCLGSVNMNDQYCRIQTATSYARFQIDRATHAEPSVRPIPASVHCLKIGSESENRHILHQEKFLANNSDAFSALKGYGGGSFSSP